MIGFISKKPLGDSGGVLSSPPSWLPSVGLGACTWTWEEFLVPRCSPVAGASRRLCLPQSCSSAARDLPQAPWGTAGLQLRLSAC